MRILLPVRILLPAGFIASASEFGDGARPTKTELLGVGAMTRCVDQR
jgi:hypothetical protein